jgi:hypothetical protein
VPGDKGWAKGTGQRVDAVHGHNLEAAKLQHRICRLGLMAMSNQYTYSLPFSKTQLKRDYDSGMTQVEIATKHKTTQKVVWRAMKRFGIKARVAAKRDQWGENNHSWKGSDASYKAMHQRLTTRFGQPKRCEACGTTDKRKSYDWANQSGNYDDVTDYRRMCRSCHWKLDEKILNMKHMREKRGCQ